MARAAQRTTLDLDRLRDYLDLHAKACGQKVRAKRVQIGYTQLQLAELIGVPFQTISKVERGEIVARDYLKAALAIRLGCEVDELFNWPARKELAVAS